jgi:hypothetical protein
MRQDSVTNARVRGSLTQTRLKETSKVDNMPKRGKHRSLILKSMDLADEKLRVPTRRLAGKRLHAHAEGKNRKSVVLRET